MKRASKKRKKFDLEPAGFLKDKSLADLDNLPSPDELAKEFIENLETGLESFQAILNMVTTSR